MIVGVEKTDKNIVVQKSGYSVRYRHDATTSSWVQTERTFGQNQNRNNPRLRKPADSCKLRISKGWNTRLQRARNRG